MLKIINYENICNKNSEKKTYTRLMETDLEKIKTKQFKYSKFIYSKPIFS